MLRHEHANITDDPSFSMGLAIGDGEAEGTSFAILLWHTREYGEQQVFMKSRDYASEFEAVEALFNATKCEAMER